MDNRNTKTLRERAARLKKELNAANDDGRYRNLSFIACGNLTRGCRRYLQRHTEKICRLQRDYELCRRILRIIDGETFSLEEMDKCRIEIMHRYPQYEVPITVCTGLVFMAEAIRKSFGGKYLRYLRKYPIRLDFGRARFSRSHPTIPYVISRNDKEEDKSSSSFLSSIVARRRNSL